MRDVVGSVVYKGKEYPLLPISLVVGSAATTPIIPATAGKYGKLCALVAWLAATQTLKLQDNLASTPNVYVNTITAPAGGLLVPFQPNPAVWIHVPVGLSLDVVTTVSAIATGLGSYFLSDVA